jgi:hypothetical protein
VLVVAVVAARSRRGRELDDKVYGSKAGWLMPGGIFWKRGRRGDTEGRRLWPYLFGPVNAWFYNAGRKRRASEGDRRQEREP